MAMERLRAQIMQQDQSGIYRINTSYANTSSRQGSASLSSPISPVTAGLTTPSSWSFSSTDKTEASAADHYGHPDRYPIGKIFDSRKACSEAMVHREIMKGISGNIHEGAYSIVANNVYEDDIDEGNVIWYTGAGGREDGFGGSEPQTADQSFEHRSNRALKRNTETKHPVRVIRGSKNSMWGPLRGYRYDGLYDVLSADYVRGKSGYMICRFKLQRRPGQVPLEDLPYM